MLFFISVIRLLFGLHICCMCLCMVYPETSLTIRNDYCIIKAARSIVNTLITPQDNGRNICPTHIIQRDEAID